MTEEDIKGLPCFQVIFSCIALLPFQSLLQSINIALAVLLFIQIYVRFLFLLILVHFCKQNQTLIAIKAPHGTTLEVPDPEEVSLGHRLMNGLQTL